VADKNDALRNCESRLKKAAPAKRRAR
jgi:hypothetical protein